MNAVDLCRRCGEELGDDEYPFCVTCYREDNEDQEEDPEDECFEDEEVEYDDDD